jgi:polysaccharide export outer membrane protein
VNANTRIARSVVTLVLASALTEVTISAQSPPATATGDQATTPAQSAAVAAWQPSYRFDVGDTVEFKFPFAPELNFTAPVRPDGAISFPYVGDVRAIGLTVAEVATRLRQRYVGILKEPEVTIIVRSFQALRVSVIGEVPAAGRVEYRQGLTVVQAVAAAGGFRDTANRGTLVLLRQVTPTSLKVLEVSVRKHEGVAGDYPLMPDDIVLVPKSGIAKLNLLISQYTRELLPVTNLGIFFNLMGASTGALSIGGGAP